MRRPHRFRAIGRASVQGDIDTLALDIIRRMRGIRHKTQAGTYIYADEQGFVYLVAEICSEAERFVTERMRHCVGLYAAPVFPLPEQIKGDLLQHFIDLGYITEVMILDAIVDVEG